MKIAGIIAEYNPFHCGHRYQVDCLREQGVTHIVAVMSSNVVQRGELSVFSKWARTKAALGNGVDIVVELPALWANASAERFAQAGVSLLHSMGCVDVLGFGSECGDLSLLCQTATACGDAGVDRQLRQNLSRGMPYHAARQQAVESRFGKKVSRVLSQPNDILAVEYLKALKLLSSRMEPLLVQRRGVEHDGAETTGFFASASALRKWLGNGELFQIQPFVPASAWNVYRDEWERGCAPALLQRVETAFLYRLRSMNPEEFALLPDVSEGLEYRLAEAARTAQSLEEFFASAKTKRYAHSRLRRIAMAAMLGITAEDFMLRPEYLRVLGLNRRGEEILHRVKACGSLPLKSSFATLVKTSRVAQIEEAATELFSLSLPHIPLGKMDRWQEIVKQ